MKSKPDIYYALASIFVGILMLLLGASCSVLLQKPVPPPPQSVTDGHQAFTAKLTLP